MRVNQIVFVGVLMSAAATFAACGGDDTAADDDDDDNDDDDDDDDDVVDAAVGPQTIRLVDDLIEDTTFIAENTYVIPRLKQLFVEPGVTLTIEPGTVIKGEQGAVLVITRGAKLEAVGTADAPILFTSAQDDDAKTRGFWGGVLILGAATINNNANSDPPNIEATFEAFTSAIPEGKFGGDDDEDDSGTLRYVRIEFAGFNFVADREFNNLTLCGVGSGTEIDYVQVHAGSDDGVEFFGGTVNAKHILSSQNGDDGFDTDNGWEGKAQFLIVQNVNPDGAREAANGYESDNHGTAASYAAVPRTLPTIYNATIVGDRDYVGGQSYAAVLRRGTGGHYFNHIITNFPLGLEARDQATLDQLDAGNLFFKNSILFNNAADGNNWQPAQKTGDIVEANYFANGDGEHAYDNRFVDPGLNVEYMLNRGTPSFALAEGAAALTGGATPPDDGFFDVTATFVGAVGTDDWTAGWTAFPQPATP